MRPVLRNLLFAASLMLTGASTTDAGEITIGKVRVEFAGTSVGTFGSLDQAVAAWMTANNIPAAQFAIRKSGELLLSHAYTLGLTGPLIGTNNVFRLASVSKMVAEAALSTLMTAGTLTGGERVFPYLGILSALLPGQTPDTRIDNIIALELAEHTSGLPGDGAGDPLFAMRDIEVALGKEPLTETQFAQYLYGTQLNSVPGLAYNYSNVGYFLLGMMVEKASGESYFNYVNKTVLQPLGMHNWLLSPTMPSKASPLEVAASDPYTGPSVFDLRPTAPLEPFAFEGGDIIWELSAAPTDLVANAESVSLFVHTWNAFGLGPRQWDYARSGCVPGVATWVESLTADIDFALLFNSQPCLDFTSSVIVQIDSALRGM